MWYREPGFSSRLDRVAAPMPRREAGAEYAPLAHVAERYRAEIEINLPTQLLPEIMRQTSAAIAAAADRRAGFAADRLDLLVNRENDVGDASVVAVTHKEIPAAGTAHALDQTAASQLREKLFQIGQGNLLPPGDLGERDRPLLAVPGEIDHPHHRAARPAAAPHLPLLIPVHRSPLRPAPPPHRLG